MWGIIMEPPHLLPLRHQLPLLSRMVEGGVVREDWRRGEVRIRWFRCWGLLVDDTRSEDPLLLLVLRVIVSVCLRGNFHPRERVLLEVGLDVVFSRQAERFRDWTY